MYNLRKPITEWRHYDCDPKTGERHMETLPSGEPVFDVRQMRARSRRGDDYLNHCYEEMRRMEQYDNRDRHAADSMRYSIEHGSMRFDNYETTDRHIVPRKKKMETKTMNEVQGLAVALLDNFTTVTCISVSRMNSLTFKKPLGMELEKGDKVVCSFHNKGLEILDVEEVHDRVVNPDDINLCWVVQKIDTTQLEHLQALDQKAVDKIKQMQQNKARRELLAEFDKDELKLLSSDLELKDD